MVPLDLKDRENDREDEGDKANEPAAKDDWEQ